VILPTKKSTAPIQKEGTGLEVGGGMMVLVKAFDGGGIFGEVKEKVEALVELLELWWF